MKTTAFALCSAAVLCLVVSGSYVSAQDSPRWERRGDKNVFTTEEPVVVTEDLRCYDTGNGAQVCVSSDDRTGLTRSLWTEMGSRQRGYLGVDHLELNEALMDHFGIPRAGGVLVSEVGDDTPAERAGLEVGDILTAVDAQEVESAQKLRIVIRQRRQGDRVNLEVWRDGKLQTLEAELAERPQMRFDFSSALFTGENDSPTYFTFQPETMAEVRSKIAEAFNDQAMASTMESVRAYPREDLEKRIRELEEQLATLQAEIRKALGENR